MKKLFALLVSAVFLLSGTASAHQRPDNGVSAEWGASCTTWRDSPDRSAQVGLDGVVVADDDRSDVRRIRLVTGTYWREVGQNKWNPPSSWNGSASRAKPLRRSSTSATQGARLKPATPQPSPGAKCITRTWSCGSWRRSSGCAVISPLSISPTRGTTTPERDAHDSTEAPRDPCTQCRAHPFDKGGSLMRRLVVLVLSLAVIQTGTASAGDTDCAPPLDHDEYCAQLDPRDTSEKMPLDIQWVTAHPGAESGFDPPTYVLSIDAYNVWDGEAVLRSQYELGEPPLRHELHFRIESDRDRPGREVDVWVYFDDEFGTYRWKAYDLTQDPPLLRGTGWALRPSPSSITVVLPAGISPLHGGRIGFAAVFSRYRRHDASVLAETDRAPNKGFVQTASIL